MENKSKNDQSSKQIQMVKTILSVKKSCTRCNGTGRLPQFNHIEGGICFKCRGIRYK